MVSVTTNSIIGNANPNWHQSSEKPVFKGMDTAKYPAPLFKNELCKLIKDQPSCAICLETFDPQHSNNHPKILKLQCNHIFHKSCINGWLSNHNSCPIDRSSVRETETARCREASFTGRIVINNQVFFLSPIEPNPEFEDLLDEIDHRPFENT